MNIARTTTPNPATDGEFVPWLDVANSQFKVTARIANALVSGSMPLS